MAACDADGASRFHAATATAGDASGRNSLGRSMEPDSSARQRTGPTTTVDHLAETNSAAFVSDPRWYSLRNHRVCWRSKPTIGISKANCIPAGRDSLRLSCTNHNGYGRCDYFADSSHDGNDNGRTNPCARTETKIRRLSNRFRMAEVAEQRC